jgi:Cu/Zn superoxide dismutase
VGRQPADTGTPPTFTGLILSEGELSMTAVGGNNPAQTITLLGVADIVQWFGSQTASFNQTATIGYIVQDARSGQIVLPGNAYDNGPVTITASPTGILTFTPISQSTPPATNGSQTFDVKCTSGSGGLVTFTASAGNHPNATYASGLTYNSNNYSNGTLSTRGFRCFGS